MDNYASQHGEHDGGGCRPQHRSDRIGFGASRSRHGHQVAPFAGADTPDFPFQAKGTRAFERGEGERLGVAQAGERLRGSHFPPEIELTHTRHGIGAESHSHAGGTERGDRGSAVAVRGVGDRTMGDRRAAIGQEPDVGVVEPNGVNAEGLGTENAVGIQPGRGADGQRGGGAVGGISEERNAPALPPLTSKPTSVEPARICFFTSSACG